MSSRSQGSSPTLLYCQTHCKDFRVYNINTGPADESDPLTFTCAVCGGLVAAKTGPGRTRSYRRGFDPVPVPDDFEIHTCGDCGETYVLPERLDELTELLRVAFEDRASSADRSEG